MKSIDHQKKYVYRQSSRILDVVSLLALIFFVLFFIMRDAASGISVFISVLITGLLIMLINYSHLWNNSLVLNSKALTLKKRIGRDRSFKWSEIRRIVVREKSSIWGKPLVQMTVFGPANTYKLLISDLKDQSGFTAQLDFLAAENNFKILYQDKRGNTISFRH
jgi:hypothetical protein